jgi:hypothetical protein
MRRFAVTTPEHLEWLKSAALLAALAAAGFAMLAAGPDRADPESPSNTHTLLQER